MSTNSIPFPLLKGCGERLVRSIEIQFTPSLSPFKKGRSALILQLSSNRKDRKRAPLPTFTRLPRGTPLLWRGWGRLSSPSSFRFPRGTPLLWRGWGRFQYPLSAAHNLPVKRRKHVKLLKTYCIFFAIISIYVTFASIFRNRYLLKVFDH